MRKTLNIAVSLCLLFAFSAQGQFWRGGFERSEFENRLENSGFATRDTVHILHYTFNYGMPNVTEVGGVDIAHTPGGIPSDSCLKVTVSGGGSDYIQQTIPSCDEYGYRLRVNISDTDTLGWNDDESLSFSELNNSGQLPGRAACAVTFTSGSLTWRFDYRDDGNNMKVVDGGTLSTDTWYRILFYMKKASASGADDGIARFWVNESLECEVTDWDNDATDYNRFNCGRFASVFDTIYYIVDVVFWSNEGLP